MKRSTIGWQVCCQRKEGFTSWEDLADLKDSHPLETAEYAMTQGIDHKPASNWWVPHVLKKRDRIIFLVHKQTTRYLKRSQKFGIEVPRLLRKLLTWTARMATPSEWMPSQRRRRRFVLPSTFYLLGILCQLNTRRSLAT